MSDTRSPRMSWYQRRKCLNINFLCSGTSGEPTTDVSDTDVTLTWGPYGFSGCFHKQVNSASAKWTHRPGLVQLSLRKAEGGAHWPSLFKGGKLSFLSPDWDKWIDSDDDDTDNESENNCKQSGISTVGGNVKGSDATAARAGKLPPPSNMELPPLSTEQLEGWQGAWVGMEMPQRMVTLAELWNAQTTAARLNSAKRLLTILGEAGGELAELQKKVKGGESVLRGLDTSVYASVARPMQWVRDFAARDETMQVDLLAMMFSLLPSQEKQLVATTLV